MIVFTEAGSLMDDTRTILIRHISVHNYAEGFILVLGKDQLVRRERPREDRRQVAHLLREVLEHWSIPPTSHILATEQIDLLDLGLFRVLVHGYQARFRKNVILVALLVVYFNIIVVRMHAECEIGGKCPRRRRPGQKRCLWVIHKWERDSHYGKCTKDQHLQRDKAAAPTGRVVDLLIILPGLKVRERREQPGRVRHNLETTVDDALFKKLFERPPNTLHETKIKRLVIIIKVDPATHALDGSAPLGRVAHDDRAAFRIILVDAHREHIRARRDSEFLVNLVLNRYAVRVPAKAPRYVETGDVCVARDDVLYIICYGGPNPAPSSPDERKSNVR
jgi:hypothetical protein